MLSLSLCLSVLLVCFSGKPCVIYHSLHSNVLMEMHFLAGGYSFSDLHTLDPGVEYFLSTQNSHQMFYLFFFFLIKVHLPLWPIFPSEPNFRLCFLISWEFGPVLKLLLYLNSCFRSQHMACPTSLASQSWPPAPMICISAPLLSSPRVLT